ncbi:unnamed protein product, partial [Leptidea sinapis]
MAIFCVANRTLNKSEGVLVLCADEEEVLLDDSILGYCMVVSSIFFAITVIVYCILPELRDLQGKSIISFCLSLGLGMCILGFMKLLEYSDLNLCAVRAFFVYFFIVASFFWSNAISIQLLMNIHQPNSGQYGWKTFLCFSMYAWGCPALLTICMAIVNYHPGHHSKPGIGLNSCWFFDTRQQWYYMYSVMSILIAANIVMFLYMSVYLWRHTFSSSHVKALKYKFFMTLRLFFIMGLPWLFEMISSLLGPHGPLIFLVLVCFRRRVIKVLLKHGYLDCMSSAIERYLALGDDDEEVIQYTTDVPMDNK